MEKWKPISGFEGYYEVCDTGNKVRSISRILINSKGKLCNINSIILKPRTFRSTDYFSVGLKLNGKQYSKSIHRLKAEAFIPNPLNLPFVNHKDGNKQNNDLPNLEWCTHLHNMRHSWDTNLNIHKAENHSMTKLSNEDVLKIRESSNSFTELGIMYGVDRRTISRIVKRKTWKSI